MEKIKEKVLEEVTPTIADMASLGLALGGVGVGIAGAVHTVKVVKRVLLKKEN
ncbi:7977_t:CDS:1, partial [Diversispora eburnea]